MNLALALALALLVASAGTPALAHGALPGVGGFYAWVAHPFLAWQHMLLLVSLGLLLSRYARAAARIHVAALAAGLAAGLIAARQGVSLPTQHGVLVACLLAGALVALAVPLRPAALASISLACGVLVGVDTGPPGDPGLTPYAGVLVGVLLIALNAMALGSLAERPPYTFAVRIAGSWIAAVAVMMLALLLRAPGAAT